MFLTLQGISAAFLVYVVFSPRWMLSFCLVEVSLDHSHLLFSHFNVKL